VFKRLGYVLTVFALLSAIGAHWHILQSVAWTTMLAENLRTNSLPKAVERTFDGKHPCSLCKQIAKGKQSEKKSEFPLEWKKFEFSYTPGIFIFSAPSQFWEIIPQDGSFPALTHAPPVPPPRTFPG